MHGFSHSHSQLLGFQINPLSHIPLSVNSLHSHLYLSLFHLCLLLQTFASNLHLQLQVSCHLMWLVSLVLDARLNTLTFMFLITSGTHKFANESLILLQLLLHLFILTLHNEVAAISESFALNLWISLPLTNNYLLQYNASSNKIFCYFQ